MGMCDWLFGKSDSPPPPPPVQPAVLSGPLSMSPSLWQFQYSPGMAMGPTVADTGWYFDFPVYTGRPTTNCALDPSCAHVNYLTYPTYAKLVGNNVVMTFEILEQGNPQYQHELKSDNIGGAPASVHLFIERYGDNGLNEFGRWWSNPLGQTLQAGTFTLSVPMTGNNWSSVYGKNSADYPAQFADVINNVGRIGMTFGGGSFFGHGVNISQGLSRMNVKSFIIT